uniref:FAD-binding oxidoreductase n=1 Tax=Candidatus Desulfatibia profunda TaxID=2841695 RepID=A0A8J6NV86_9BACT|nr:FAD-binding oxidoreductase [Candidatus Desulfatibia profunda]
MLKELPEKTQVVIIGSGVIGAAVAYYLTQRGLGDVVVLEQGDIGAQGATSFCLGGLRTQFATAVNIRFSLISRNVFKKFKHQFGIDPVFKPLGYLFLAATREQWALFENTARLMAKMQLPVELLPSPEVGRRWPFIRSDDLAGGSYTKDDGFYGPMEVLQGFVKAARRGGALFFEKTAAAGFSIFGKTIKSVLTAAGHEIRTDVVVNAAGPWAGQLAAKAGLNLPVEPLQRHLFFTDTFDELPDMFPMIIDINSGWYLKREGRGLLLGGPAGENSFSHNVAFDAEEWTAAESIRRVPVLERARIVRGWVGHYEITPDHHAVIGAFPELENFICAAGFSGHGFQHAPATGMIVAELIVDKRAQTEDIYPLRPARFRENDLIYEPITAFRK